MMEQCTILVPIYNEEQTLIAVMNTLAEECADAHIVYIDDGSKDRSLTILHSYARSKDVVLSKENGGKGSAIRLGLEQAKSAYTVIQDADTEYNPKEIELLLKEAIANKGTAVFGSRFLQPNPNIYKRFLLGNKVMTHTLNFLYGSNITDSYTCYKLLPTELFQSLQLQSRGFEMEAEICAKLLRMKVEIREVPISYKPRTIEEGKKIGWKDAWKGIVMMLKLRLVPASRFNTLHHKPQRENKDGNKEGAK